MLRKMLAVSSTLVPLWGLVAAPASADAKAELKNSLVEFAAETGGAENLLALVARVLAEVDRDGDGLRKAEIDFAEAVFGAQERASLATARLRFDLDGDLAVSKDEIERSMVYQLGRARQAGSNAAMKERLKRQVQQQVQQLMVTDADGDGVLRGGEVTAADPQRPSGNRRSKFLDVARALLAADPNNDGVVSEAESLQVLGEVFADVGNIAELVDKRQAERRKTGNDGGDTCPKFDVPGKAKLVVLGVYEGESVSTVSVTGQDVETSTATINIEPGAEPLALIITSYDAMVWQIKGATERVAKVYVSSVQVNPGDGKSAVGVTGIARNKVAFLPGVGCLRYFNDAKSPDAVMLKARVEKSAGRPADQIIGLYGVEQLSLPSATSTRYDGFALGGMKLLLEGGKDGVAVTTVKDGEQARQGPRDLLLALQRFYRGGVDQIALGDVVSDTKAEYYAVLPQQAGLLQLVQAGKLEMMDTRNFKVTGEMRFPAGLNGAHSVRFILPKGVALPAGNPGHSSVFSEEKADFVVAP